MIPKVHKRGRRVGGLLRYLYGPGRFEEHTKPRLIAAWHGAGDLGALEPPVGVSGRRDFRHLVGLLEQPVRAGAHRPRLSVWHCSVRNHDTDRYLTDAQWAHIAGEVMAAVGLAPHSDLEAVRWVAVRHADNHIHLVATLVRQDGRTAWAWHDRPRSHAACRDLERRYGLRRVGPTDRTAVPHPTTAERRKADRLGRARPARVELRRRVRAALASSMSEVEFATRLRDAGVLVEFRRSSINPDEYTGYKAALANDTAADGTPVWFNGGRLAADLTLPKLRRRWATPATAARPTPRRRSPASDSAFIPFARTAALRHAARLVAGAAHDVHRATLSDPVGAQAAAQAAADLFTAMVHTVEAGSSGPLSRAAELFDRAARAAYGHVARATSRSYELRAMARAVWLLGRVSGKDDAVAMIALVLELARFGDTLASLRMLQQRLHQAEAAKSAAALLRESAATSTHALATPAITPVATHGRSFDVGRRPTRGR